MPSILDDSGGKDRRCLVLWSEYSGAIARELPAVILNEDAREITLRVSQPLAETTPVYIRGANNPGNGIVKSCFLDGNDYRLQIELDCEEMLRFSSPQVDPGVFAVDSFLTEEQEQKILESLGDFGSDETATLEQDPDSQDEVGSATAPFSSASMGLRTPTILPVQ